MNKTPQKKQKKNPQRAKAEETAKAEKTDRPLIIMHSRRAPLGGGRKRQYRH